MKPDKLTEITIENFRSIDRLELRDLGDINVVNTGNDVGNTHVLDAVQLYAGRGSPQVIREILLRDDEFLNGTYDGPVLPDRDALFHDRDNGAEISISGQDCRLAIRVDEQDLEQNTLTVSTQGRNRRVSLENPYGFRFHPGGERDATTCIRVGPREPDNDTLVGLYYPIALTDGEERVAEFITRVAGTWVDRIGSVGDQERARVMVRTPGSRTPVPLRSLGPETVQAAHAAMALENARGGILLLDQAHTRIRPEAREIMWRSIALGIRGEAQVFTTTDPDKVHRAPAAE